MCMLLVYQVYGLLLVAHLLHICLFRTFYYFICFSKIEQTSRCYDIKF
jgi:hypothetical protein